LSNPNNPLSPLNPNNPNNPANPNGYAARRRRSMSNPNRAAAQPHRLHRPRPH
jgi:hypothetical protein